MIQSHDFRWNFCINTYFFNQLIKSLNIFENLAQAGESNITDLLSIAITNTLVIIFAKFKLLLNIFLLSRKRLYDSCMYSSTLYLKFQRQSLAHLLKQNKSLQRLGSRYLSHSKLFFLKIETWCNINWVCRIRYFNTSRNIFRLENQIFWKMTSKR